MKIPAHFRLVQCETARTAGVLPISLAGQKLASAVSRRLRPAALRARKTALHGMAADRAALGYQRRVQMPGHPVDRNATGSRRSRVDQCAAAVGKTAGRSARGLVDTMKNRD